MLITELKKFDVFSLKRVDKTGKYKVKRPFDDNKNLPFMSIYENPLFTGLWTHDRSIEVVLLDPSEFPYKAIGED